MGQQQHQVWQDRQGPDWTQQLLYLPDTEQPAYLLHVLDVEPPA
jgi:hypothetical protein